VHEKAREVKEESGDGEWEKWGRQKKKGRMCNRRRRRRRRRRRKEGGEEIQRQWQQVFGALQLVSPLYVAILPMRSRGGQEGEWKVKQDKEMERRRRREGASEERAKRRQRRKRRD